MLEVCEFWLVVFLIGECPVIAYFLISFLYKEASNGSTQLASLANAQKV